VRNWNPYPLLALVASVLVWGGLGWLISWLIREALR